MWLSGTPTEEMVSASSCHEKSLCLAAAPIRAGVGRAAR